MELGYDPSIPLCSDMNPYVLKGDGWLPKNIVIVSRMIYMYLSIYMAFVVVLSVLGNGIVILAFLKNKVSGRSFCCIAERLWTRCATRFS